MLYCDAMQWQCDAWLSKGYSIVMHCKESKGEAGLCAVSYCYGKAGQRNAQQRRCMGKHSKGKA